MKAFFTNALATSRGDAFETTFLEVFRGTMVVEVGSLNELNVDCVLQRAERAKVVIWVGESSQVRAVEKATKETMALPSGDRMKFTWNEQVVIPLGVDAEYNEMLENALCAGHTFIVGFQVMVTADRGANPAWKSSGSPAWVHLTHLARYAGHWTQVAIPAEEGSVACKVRFKHSKSFAPATGLPISHSVFSEKCDFEIEIGDASSLNLKNGRRPERCACRLNLISPYRTPSKHLTSLIILLWDPAVLLLELHGT